MSEIIHQSVIIKRIEGKYAWVISTEDSACANCASKSSCSSTNLLKPLLDATIKNKGLRVVNSLNAAVDDRVEIALSSTSLLKATMLAYLLPLLCLFIFAWLGKMFFGETVSIFMGVAGLFVGFYLVKIRMSETHHGTGIEPVMIKVDKPSVSTFQIISPNSGS
jgi:sigma-E factor negative regulatory protein RseC